MKRFVFTLLLIAICGYTFAQGITVFRDANWQGASLVIHRDWDAGANPGWNDQISSIRIPAGYKIEIFEHGSFGGASKVLTGDWTVTDRNFNDIISSIKFLEHPGRGNNRTMVSAKDRLCCGQELALDKTLESPNGHYFLVFQQDRNIVLYKRQNGDKPLWATATNDKANRCVMQADGNLVVYNNTAAVWASNTNGNTNATLILQDDGNLVIYSSDGRALWATNTAQPEEKASAKDRLCCGQELALDKTLESPNGLYFLVFQQDRNIVLYKRQNGDKPLWATATNNRINKCVMQADGNLVASNNNTPVWTSNTYGNANASLVLQDDGNLVIYAADGRSVWASNTVQAVEQPIVTPVVVAPSSNMEPCSMPDQQYKAALAAITAQSFKDPQLKMAKTAIKGKCLSLEQIRGIVKLFSFEDQTLDFLKYAYDFTNSKTEYYTLSDVFSFTSNSQNFMAFLEAK